jgi:hypothetical protein
MSAAAVARPTRFPMGRIDLALLAFALFGTIMAVGLAQYHDRPWALAALVAVPAALAFRNRPQLAALFLGAGSMLLRLAYAGIGATDQIAVSQAAAARVFAGLSPYGIGYAATNPPGAPYPYGPIGVVWWSPGPPIELVAAALVLAVLARERAWFTFGLYASVPFVVYLNATGVNDYSLGLLIAIGLLLLRHRPLAGAGILALAGALKPYAAAWFLPAIGFGGVQVGMALLAATLVLWSPLLFWGPGGFLRSLDIARTVHRQPENALGLPALRWLAVPITAAGLLVRRWEWMVLVGALTFVVFLFMDRWASLGYWVAVGPITGIALERLWVQRREPMRE